jgi:tellurite resistance protein TerC
MYQHRVLFWGIIGALVMRGAMIAIGVELIQRFTWIIYVFGAFLIITGARMLFMGESHTDPNRNPLVKLARRLMPVTERYHGQHFFVRGGSNASHEPPVPGAEVQPDRVADNARPGVLMATPLLLALIMIEFTDLIFAVDSIPAIFAISADPFLVFTSNVFAILGLRSLYFALAGMIDRFHYLKIALSFVLILVGIKMLTHVWLKELLGKHFNLYLLAAVLSILAAGVIASLLRPAPKKE